MFYWVLNKSLKRFVNPKIGNCMVFYQETSMIVPKNI